MKVATTCAIVCWDDSSICGGPDGAISVYNGTNSYGSMSLSVLNFNGDPVDTPITNPTFLVHILLIIGLKV